MGIADASGEGGGRCEMCASLPSRMDSGVETGEGKGESTSGSVRFADREVRNAAMNRRVSGVKKASFCSPRIGGAEEHVERASWGRESALGGH